MADIGKLTVDALEYTTPIFNAFWDNGKSKPETDRETGEQISTYTSGDYMPKNSREFTDGATINALVENAYGYRFDLTGGYVAEFRRANGCRTIMYIPKARRAESRLNIKTPLNTHSPGSRKICEARGRFYIYT